MQISLRSCFQFLWRHTCLEEKLLGPVVSFIFRNCHTCSIFQFFYILTNIYFQVLDMSPSTGRETVFYFSVACLSLMSYDSVQFFHMFAGHLDVFFGKIFFQILWPRLRHQTVSAIYILQILFLYHICKYVFSFPQVVFSLF